MNNNQPPHGDRPLSTQIQQSLFKNVQAEKIEVGSIQQNVNYFPNPRPKPEGIPENIPFRGAATFVGRERSLEILHRQLQRVDRVAISAIAGMGGVGKTEMAVQYARQYLTTYPGGVCWLQARNGELDRQVVEYAQIQLGLQVPQELGGKPLLLTQQLEWCWHHWQPSGKVLLVLDDVTDLTECQPALVVPSRFRVLLTTRQRALDPSFFELPLEVLSAAASLNLLTELIGSKERVAREPQAAAQLCEWLGYLPLGLEVVGRYLARDRALSLADMQDRLQAQRIEDEALDKTYPGMTAQREVRAAFELSWRELDADAAEGARLLSFFAPDVIPWWLVENVMRRLRGSDYTINAVRKQLDNLHLVQPVNTGADNFKVHPLIQKFFQGKQMQAKTANNLEQAFVETMVAIVRQISDTPTLKQIQAVTKVMPHLAEVADKRTTALRDEDLFWAFVRLGKFYKEQGLYTLAEPWLYQCITVLQERLGKEHSDVAASFNNLAELYRSQGRYTEAEPLYLQALKLSKRMLGEEHPNVATSLNNLALLYHSQGRYSKAEPLYLQALDLSKRVLEEDHSDGAASLNNLALLYHSQGRYGEAEPLYLKALVLRKRLLGEHPNVATSLNNLALLYFLQGRYVEAEPLYLQALALRKRVLGEEHPDVAMSFDDLAKLYRSQERYSEAKLLYLQALALRKRVLGEEHPDVAVSLNNLAVFYAYQERYREAEPLLVQALNLRQRLLGETHSHTVSSRRSLKNLRTAMRSKNSGRQDALLLPMRRLLLLLFFPLWTVWRILNRMLTALKRLVRQRRRSRR